MDIKEVIMWIIVGGFMSFMGLGIYMQLVDLPDGMYNSGMGKRNSGYCWVSYYDSDDYGQVYPIHDVMVFDATLPQPKRLCDIIRDKCIDYTGNTDMSKGNVSSSIPCEWIESERTCQCEPYRYSHGDVVTLEMW